MDELAEVLAAYLDFVWTEIMDRHGRTQEESDPTRKVSPVPPAVRVWFEECEQGERWDRLVATCAQLLGKDRRRTARWQTALKHWMRRGGVYGTVLDGKRPDHAKAVDSLVGEVDATEGPVVYLALLEGVYFRGRETRVMDFADFQILRPTVEYLESLLGIPVNRIFYPRAVCSTEHLTNHWYLRFETHEPRPRPGQMIYDPRMFESRVRPTFSEFHPMIEAALKRLILCDRLGPKEEVHPAGWWRISVPFIIKADRNPLKSPPPAPPIERLSYRPAFDIQGEKIGEEPGIEEDRGTRRHGAETSREPRAERLAPSSKRGERRTGGRRAQRRGPRTEGRAPSAGGCKGLWLSAGGWLRFFHLDFALR